MSNRHTPPWRDRIQRAAATPVAQVPFRESTGLWRTMMSKLECEDQERRFHQRPPASWRTEVEGLPVPIWLKGAPPLAAQRAPVDLLSPSGRSSW